MKSAPADAGRIKGVAFREFAIWYAANVSADHVKSVVGALEATHPLVFDSERAGFGILATQWYDALLVHDFVNRLVAGHGADSDALAQAAANDIMNNTLTGIYRFVFSTFATPTLYARHASKLWNLHYDSGVVTIDVKDLEARSRYTGWRAHHPFICKLNMSATVPIYRAMGCRNVVWRKLACIADGDAACEMHIRWTR